MKQINKFCRIVNEIPYWVMLLLMICFTIYAPWELTRIIIRDIHEMTPPISTYIVEIAFFIFCYILAILLIAIRIKNNRRK
jgi:hypothetical protein